MSGASGDAECPVCEGLMLTYNDWKPHDYVSGFCTRCGFAYYTERFRKDFSEIENELLELDMEAPNKKEYDKWKEKVEKWVDYNY